VILGLPHGCLEAWPRIELGYTDLQWDVRSFKHLKIRTFS